MATVYQFFQGLRVVALLIFFGWMGYEAYTLRSVDFAMLEELLRQFDPTHHYNLAYNVMFWVFLTYGLAWLIVDGILRVLGGLFRPELATLIDEAVANHSQRRLRDF